LHPHWPRIAPLACPSFPSYYVVVPALRISSSPLWLLINRAGCTASPLSAILTIVVCLLLLPRAPGVNALPRCRLRSRHHGNDGGRHDAAPSWWSRAGPTLRRRRADVHHVAKEGGEGLFLVEHGQSSGRGGMDILYRLDSGCLYPTARTVCISVTVGHKPPGCGFCGRADTVRCRLSTRYAHVRGSS